MPEGHSQQSQGQNGIHVAEGDSTADFAGQLSKSLQDNQMSRLKVTPGRRPSKSVSSTRPPISYKRTQSYHQSKSSYSGTPSKGPPSPSPNLVPSPMDTPGRTGLKRRTSTPSLAIHLLPEEEEFQLPPPIPEAGPSFKGKEKEKVDNRARSKSTSIAYPPVLDPSAAAHVRRPPSPLRPHASLPIPQPHWAEAHRIPPQAAVPTSTSTSASLLTKAYDLGESSLSRLANWVKPAGRYDDRRSSEDSERGLSEEDDGEPGSGSTESVGTTRTSTDSYRFAPGGAGGKGRYWGLSDEDEGDGGYFSLPPTPPEETAGTTAYPPFDFVNGSLPTPALSAHSLSKPKTGRRRIRQAHTRNDDASDGWLKHLLSFGSGTKTGQVIRELGWTVGILAMLFVVTLGLVLWLVRGMPITTLKHIPQSTTDLQLLSAEIRSYMTSGDPGWYHTIGVLVFVGCWKHAWSVPGAVVLNILVGSILEPMAALALLTFITATGSLLSYCLSRPLAPLISVLFPKPLALVRAALAPETVPSPPSSAPSHQAAGEYITPVQVSADPTAVPVGATTNKQAVWRRLLVMRAMGFVPWSGMNVACGVVGVDWKTFWLTTAAGSASWSYVTASVGNILSRLALPRSADSSDPLLSVQGGEHHGGGESLTSLLRDPVLIAKLVFLTLLTLLPVVIKRRRSASTSPGQGQGQSADAADGAMAKPVHPSLGALRNAGVSGGGMDPPMSPITQSLARFTPTPAVFDLLSFGRTVLRQGGKYVQLGIRGVSEGAGRVAAAVGR